MEWWLFIAIWLMTVLENAAAAVYTCKVVERRPVMAALIGSNIDLLGCVGVIVYTSRPEYVIAIWLGSFCGTFLGTKYNQNINETLLNWERRRNLKTARKVKALFESYRQSIIM